MTTIEYWIQIENNPWDVSPKNIDRMTGETIEQITGKAPVNKILKSPETGVERTRRMYQPLEEDALIFRRYTENWASPDDRKVNPWDLNEPNPTDNGTMGTIPGPVIECKVGDNVIVHFRNKDLRSGKDVISRTHSLHPHGIVFDVRYDGAYPLSPPDPDQPVGGESSLWSSVGVTSHKKGDRVPPGGTFTYRWDTFGWPSTAGVWLYHDHAPCDMINVKLGAIGILVIHNPKNLDDVVEQDLPKGSLINYRCFPLPDLEVLPHDFNQFILTQPQRELELGSIEDLASLEMGELDTETNSDEHGKKVPNTAEKRFMIKRGDFIFEIKDFKNIVNFCFPRYTTPPKKALYLQLYHEMPGVGMTINGRQYLGNTPTLIAGVNTKMQFGLVAMNDFTFHTFHLHGHRWTIPGPNGTDPNAIQTSPLNTAVSQFEDTKIFGPANSFSFTINQGSFMGSRFTTDTEKASGLGEWHMHCHVLNHMMGGMMGSLLVIRGGEMVLRLPHGEPCTAMGHNGNGTPPVEIVVKVKNNVFDPKNLTISKGDAVTWVWETATSHSTTSDDGIWDSGIKGMIGATFSHTFDDIDIFPYYCIIHGGPGGISMAGTVTVT